jgi:pimeloyl-ACP methyl ester carboxylesterase
MVGSAPGAVTTESVAVDGVRLEVAWHGEASTAGPTLVFLHEGLGCAAMWRDFPRQVAADVGARVLVYSRQGYGGSDPVSLPRPLTYMHDEGQKVLPKLLETLGIDDAVLVGHSDGGSIALVYAGSEDVHAHARLRGLVLMAPHVFCEDVSVDSIREARVAFEQGDLRAKLARYHGTNTDGAFWGWNDAWLDPEFRRWSLEAFLPEVRVPTVVLQGADDRYGTLAQVDAIERGIGALCKRIVVEGCGHDPAREAPEATRRAIRELLVRVRPPSRRETTAP